MKAQDLGIVGLVAVCGGVVALGMTDPLATAETVASADVQRETVRSLTRACPELFKARERVTTVTLASVPGISDGQSPSGAVDLVVSGQDVPLATLDTMGSSVAVTEFPAEATYGRSSAVEGLAPGSVVARSSLDTDGVGSGLVSAACAEPTSTTWLLGGGSEPGQRDRIILLNPTDSSAVVDLEIYGPDGVVEAPGTDNITVKPNGRTERRLDAFVTDLPVSAVKVKTSVGLVSAFILDDRMEELTPRGADLVADAGAASQRQVIPGLPTGSGIRDLVLLAPDADADVSVRLLTDDGPQVLDSATGLTLKQNRATRVDLSADLAGRGGTLDIQSSAPVLAQLTLQTRESAADAAARKKQIAEAKAALDAASGAKAKAKAAEALSKVKVARRDSGSDVAFLAPTASLASPGAVTSILPSSSAMVGVAALDDDASVRISVMEASGAAAVLEPVKEFKLAAGTSKQVAVKAPGGNPYTIVVERIDGSGRIFAGHTQSGAGRAITGYGIPRLATEVAVPEARSVVGP